MAVNAQSLLILLPCIFPFFCADEVSVPNGVQRELYCLGCETTVKVFDHLLRGVPQNKLDETVNAVLSSACMPDNFDLSEVSKEILSSACIQLIKEYRQTLREMLVTEYSHHNMQSYLSLVQRVCLGLTGACHGVLHDDHDHDPLTDDANIKLDKTNNEFVILPGKNLKMAKPVSEMHEEL